MIRGVGSRGQPDLLYDQLMAFCNSQLWIRRDVPLFICANEWLACYGPSSLTRHPRLQSSLRMVHLQWLGIVLITTHCCPWKLHVIQDLLCFLHPTQHNILAPFIANGVYQRRDKEVQVSSLLGRVNLFVAFYLAEGHQNRATPHSPLPRDSFYPCG